MSDTSFQSEGTRCVLSKWNDRIVSITGMSRGSEIRTAYTVLITTLQAQGFVS